MIVELKVCELKPLSDIGECIVAEYPKIVGTMIYIAITAVPTLHLPLESYLAVCIALTSFTVAC